MHAATDVAEVVVRGMTLRIPADPVYLADAEDCGTLLLAEVMEIQERDSVLVVGGGSGLLALVAGRLAGRGRVVVVCGQVASAAQVEAAIRLDGASNVEVVRSGDLAPLRGREFDVALVSVSLAPSGSALDRQVQQAALLLRPGGRCYLAGGKRQGIVSAASRLEETFGNAQTLAYRKGHRVVLALREAEVRASWEGEPERAEEVELRGRTYRIGVREGVFAEGRLDEGTRLLIETLEVRARDVVLDLGCGSGLVGLVAADLAPQGTVYLVDSDVAAVELAGENLRRNGVANAVALASDGFSALGDLTFDVIATNPPFHVGRLQTMAIALRFVEQSARHLRRGGRFYLVANRFLKYEPAVEAAFGNVQTVAETSRYKVLLAVGRGRHGSIPSPAPTRFALPAPLRRLGRPRLAAGRVEDAAPLDARREHRPRPETQAVDPPGESQRSSTRTSTTFGPCGPASP